MAGLVKRGEIWLANLDPGFGREIHKKRPVLIISSSFIQETTTDVIIIPASSRITYHSGPDVVPLGRMTNLTKPSILLPILIRSIDNQRLIKKIGKIRKARMAKVEAALKFVLGL